MKRKRLGGNKKEKFTEGWVEFERKSIAKRVAASLNNTPVGGKKRDFHASDIWNMRYLSKFKWSDLTEQMGTLLAVSASSCFLGDRPLLGVLASLHHNTDKCHCALQHTRTA